MAFIKVHEFKTGEGTYTVRYEAVLGDFDVRFYGPGVEEPFVSSIDHGFGEHQAITYLCRGTTKHTIRATMQYPFAYVELTPDSTDCGFVIQPQPQPEPVPEPTPIEEAPPRGQQTVYQIAFKNVEGQFVFVWIYDMDTYSAGATPVIYDLKTPQGNYPASPLVIRTVDNDEDKFTPIRAKEAVIQFYSTSKYDISTFATGDDKRWYVKAFIGDETNVIFNGYLLASELKQAYQPNPNAVVMTATDGLAGLKEIPLVNEEDKNPIGKYRVVDYFYLCLRKTGLNLDINIVNNLSEETPTAFLPFVECAIDAKTFEDEIGVSEDCYTVLEKLLGHDCFLQQHAGRWYIQRVDEMEGERRIAQYNYVGQYQGIIDLPLEHEIGPGKPIIHIQEDQQISYEQPRKSIKMLMRYNYPEELVCNTNWERGDFSAPFTKTYTKEVDGRAVEVVETYSVPECWTMRNNAWGGPALSSNAFGVRVREDDYLKESYLVITAQFNGQEYANSDYLESEDVLVEQGDRISISVDFRLRKNYTLLRNPTFYWGKLFLWADDGAFWYYREDIGKWFTIGSQRTTGGFLKTSWDSNNTDSSQWQSLSVELPEIPASGRLRIGLFQFNQYNGTGQDDLDVLYKGLRVELQPFINGSYTEYSGHYHTYTQATKAAAKYEGEVFIGDAPRKSMKGHIFTTGNKSAKRFFDGRKGLPPVKPALYSKIQALSVWNQYNRFFTVLEGSHQGLKTGGQDIPDSIYLYRFTDPNKAVNNKLFFLLSFEQDFATCEWTGVFIEIFDTEMGKRDGTADAWDFRYLED